MKCFQDAFFETHMMVQNPQQWIESMADAGVDQYTFHIEPVIDEVTEISRKVREAGMKVGLALKPGTDLSALEKYIPLADLVLVMTVEPGFGGQKFMANQMPKVQWLREHYPNLDIEVDGGVGPETIDQCASAGANMIVSGTAIIRSNDQKDVISRLRSSVENAINKC